MRLRGERARRRIGVDMSSWEWMVVPCKAGTTLSIMADLVGEGSFNLYVLGSDGVIQAPVRGRISGFDSRKALWSQQQTRSVATKYTVTESDTLYIFFDNQHDDSEGKWIDIDISLQNR